MYVINWPAHLYQDEAKFTEDLAVVVDASRINLDVLCGDVWSRHAVATGTTNRFQYSILDVHDVDRGALSERGEDPLTKLLAGNQHQAVAIATAQVLCSGDINLHVQELPPPPRSFSPSSSLSLSPSLPLSLCCSHTQPYLAVALAKSICLVIISSVTSSLS